MSLPHALDSEGQVLAAVISQPAILPEITDLLTGDDFYSTTHQAIFTTVLSMVSRGEHLDPLTIARRAHDGKGIDPVVVSDLLRDLVTPAGAVRHAQIVREHAQLRKLAVLGAEVSEQATGRGAKVETIVSKAEVELFRVATGLNEHLPWSKALSNATDAIEHQYQTGQLVTGIPMGLRPLDEALGGLQPGWLTYVAARPGVGKTAFAMQAGVHAAREGYEVMVASLEMSQEQLAQRTLCSVAGVSYSKVRHGMLTDQDWARMANAQLQLQALPIEVYDRLDNVPQIRTRVRRHRPKLLIVDYVQLVKDRRAHSREEEIAEVSRGLKLMAEDSEVTVLAAAQLNRKPEAEGRPPSMSDLRGSGALEQDADVIFLMHRQEGGTAVTFDRAKFRHGPSGKDTLRWDPEITKFYEHLG